MSQFDFKNISNYLLPDLINDRMPIANLPNDLKKVKSFLEELGIKVIETGLTFGTEIPDVFSAINILVYSGFDLMKVYEYLSDQRNYRFCKNVYPLTERCGFCMSENVDVYFSTSCTHGACRKCITDHIFDEMEKIRKGTTEVCRCIGSKKGKCRVLLNGEFMKGLGPKFHETLRDVQVEYFLGSKSVIRCCTRLFYNPISKMGKGKLISVTCNFCKKGTCFSCQKRFRHIPLPCELLEEFNRKSRYEFRVDLICNRIPSRVEICQFCKPTLEGGKGEVIVAGNDFVACPKCYSRWCYRCGKAPTFLERSENMKHTNCKLSRDDTDNWKTTEKFVQKGDRLMSVHRNQTDFAETFLRYSFYMGTAKEIYEELETMKKMRFTQQNKLWKELTLQFVALKFLSHVIVLKYYLTTAFKTPEITRIVKQHFKEYVDGGTQEKFIDFEVSELERILVLKNVRSEQILGKLIILYRRIYELSIDETYLPTEKEFFVTDDHQSEHQLPSAHLPDFMGDRDSPFTIFHTFIKGKYSLENYKSTMLLSRTTTPEYQNFLQKTPNQEDLELKRAIEASIRISTPIEQEDPELVWAIRESQKLEREKLQKITEESQKLEEERIRKKSSEKEEMRLERVKEEERVLAEVLRISQMEAIEREERKIFGVKKGREEEKEEEEEVVEEEEEDQGEEIIEYYLEDDDSNVTDEIDEDDSNVSDEIDEDDSNVSDETTEDDSNVTDDVVTDDEDDMFGGLKSSRKKKEEEDDEDEEEDVEIDT